MRVWDNYITPDVKEMYQHYRSEPKIGTKPCLLLIDLYNLSYKGGDAPVSEVIKTKPPGCGEHAHKAVKPTQMLISLFQNFSCPSSLLRGTGKRTLRNTLHPAATEEYFRIRL